MGVINENNKTFTCPNCGASLVFDPKSQNVKCSHCGTEFKTEDLNKFKESLDKTEQKEINWDEQSKNFTKSEAEKLKVYYCQNCGGNLVTDENTSSTVCPYCGSPVILKERLSGDLKPDYVLPFKQDKSVILDTYYKYVKKHLFVKSDFLNKNELDAKFQGIYVPYWLFTTDTEGSANFRAEIVTSWSDSDYVYTKTSHYALYRAGQISYDHLPHDASSRMPDALMESVEPFYFKNAKPFSAEYLSGHAADRYDVPVKDVEQHVNERMRNTLVDFFRRSTIGYTHVTCTSSSITLIDPKVEYALYPVWIFNSLYKGKKYTFGMNGDTGKMTGNLPLSIGKFFLWFFIWILGLGGIAFGITAAIMQGGMKMPFQAYEIAIGAGVGLVGALIFCIYHTVKLKPVKKAMNAVDYVVKDSYKLTDSWDTYLYSTVTKVRVSKK